MYVKEDIVNLSSDALFQNVFGCIDLFDSIFWIQETIKQPLGKTIGIQYTDAPGFAPTGLIAQFNI